MFPWFDRPARLSAGGLVVGGTRGSRSQRAEACEVGPCRRVVGIEVVRVDGPEG